MRKPITILMAMAALVSISAICAEVLAAAPAGPQMDSFWQQNGATIDRNAGRMFIGGAVQNDGAYPNRSADWLAGLQTSWGHPVGYTTGGILNVLTNDSISAAYAVIGGAQTRNFRRTAAAIGMQGYGICNSAATTSSCWGFYGEAHRVAGSGSAYAMELDPVGHIASIVPTPIQQGNLIGQQIACGGEYARIIQHPCSAAVQLAANGAPFFTGINVMQGAIASGHAALQLPTGNGITFYDRAGHEGGAIDADFTSGNTSNLIFTDNGLQVSGSDGSAVAIFAPLSKGVSHLVLSGAAKDEAPSVSARGSRSDVDLRLSPQGAGVISAAGPLRLVPTKFAALPACAAGTLGTLALVVDAASPITQWHQQVTAGGGASKVFIACNGAGWFAFAY